MFQGSPNESIRNRIPFAYEPGELDAVLLTHAHLDHCGLLPLLVKSGYRGRIHATAGTIELATLVLLDSGKLHEEFAKRDARWEKHHPDKVAADDRRQADQYEAALELARAGESDEPVPAESSAAPSPTEVAAADRGHRADSDRGPGADCAVDLATRPGGRAASTTPAARHRPGRAALHGQGRRGRPRPVRAAWLRRGGRGRAGHPCHVRRCRPYPRLGDHPRPRHRAGRRPGTRDRLLGRPRPTGHPDPARPHADGRSGLRARRIDLRRPRARSRSRGHPDPGRDGQDGRRCRWRPARPIVRDRPYPGGRLGARSVDRAWRDPAPAALPRFADGLEGVRRLPPPSGLLRRGDGRPSCARVGRRSTTRTRSSPTT